MRSYQCTHYGAFTVYEFEGRGDEVHILPLSFSEYYAFKQGDKSEAYDDYSVYGGLPAVALMTTEEQKTNYLISQMKNGKRSKTRPEPLEIATLAI